MGCVRLKNMVFYGYHGVAEQEKVLGGKFEVDVELEFNMDAAIRSDHLQDTINYEKIYQMVQDVVTHSKFYLLEALAGKIIAVIFANERIEAITVRIRKPGAPIRGVLDTVEVEISRRRDQLARSD